MKIRKLSEIIDLLGLVLGRILGAFKYFLLSFRARGARRDFGKMCTGLRREHHFRGL